MYAKNPPLTRDFWYTDVLHIFLGVTPLGMMQSASMHLSSMFINAWTISMASMCTVKKDPHKRQHLETMLKWIIHIILKNRGKKADIWAIVIPWAEKYFLCQFLTQFLFAISGTQPFQCLYGFWTHVNWRYTVTYTNCRNALVLYKMCIRALELKLD